MADESTVLAIESATHAGSAAVGRGDQVISEVLSNLRFRHSSTLLPAVDHALRIAETAREQVDAVVVGAGPGSFTGVRIAAATAKGIAHALNCPLQAYSTLLCLAAPLLQSGRPVLAVLDARNRQVYAAMYRIGESLETLLEPGSFKLDEMLDRGAHAGPVIVCGDAVVRHRGEIEARLEAVFPATMLGHPRASSLLWLHRNYPELGAVRSAAEWEPEYHRASGAERIRAEKLAGA